MFWGTAEMVAREMHLDNLRRAEREQLADAVTAQQHKQSGWWQSVRQSLTGQQTELNTSGGKLVEKTA